MKPLKAKHYVLIAVGFAAISISSLVKVASVRAELKRVEEEMRQFEREVAAQAETDRAIAELLAKPKSDMTSEDNARLIALLKKSIEARRAKDPSGAAVSKQKELNQRTTDNR